MGLLSSDSQLIFTNQQSIKSLTSEGKRNTFKTSVNDRLGVRGNTSQPHRSGSQNEKFCLDLIRGLRIFFNFFNINIEEASFRLLTRRLITFSECNSIKTIADSYKYFCYYRFNKYIGDNVPYPKPEVLFDFHPSISIKRYLDRKLSSRRKANTFFLISFMYNKRILDPLPQELINDALDKHKTTLSTPPTIPSDEILSFIDEYIRKDMSSMISKTGSDRIHSLSTRSSFKSSLRVGGQQGEISLNLPPVKGGCDLRKFAIINNSMNGHIQRVQKDMNSIINDTICSSVKPATVLEPLKVRIVTSEESYMSRCKTTQVDLWKNLLKKEEFALTRGEDLNPLLSKYLLNESSLPLWISGDYSAATDNLNRHIINNVTTGLLPYLRSEDHKSFLLNSGLHNIHYKDGVEKQENGQLMGSLTSFPLLCYINYLAYQYCCLISPKDFSSFCLINGDDILFRATQKGYDLWKEIVPCFGLTPSLGKNYSSEKFFMINSRVFFVNKEGLEIKEMPFVNWALLNKSPINTKADPYFTNVHVDHNPFDPPYGAMLRCLWKQAQASSLLIKKKLYGLFLNTHKKRISQSTRDLLVPTILGGMGGLDLSEFQKTKLLTKGQRLKMVNGFRFRLSLYALRRGLYPVAINSVNKQATIFGRAVAPYIEGGDPELDPMPLMANKFSFINKKEQRSLPKVKTWLRRVIGPSSFIKTRIPDGVPNLL